MDVPAAVPGAPAELLDPRRTWTDPAAYDQAAELAAKFVADFATAAILAGAPAAEPVQA